MESDRCLYEIRQRLKDLVGGSELDFYWSPLREVWDDATDGEASPREAMRHKSQIVLYGPPGTGKTFEATAAAESLVRSALLKTLGPKEYFERARKDQVQREIDNRVHRLQLHPAFGYEAFIVGLQIDSNGATTYQLGVLPKLVETMSDDPLHLPHVLILDEMNRTDLSRMLGECFSLFENRDIQIKLPAVDSTGRPYAMGLPKNLYVIGTMNLIDQSLEQIDFALRRRFLWIECGFNGEAFMDAAEQRWGKLKNVPAWERVESDFQKLRRAAAALNREIATSDLLGDQYQIGHTYLLDVVSFLAEDMDGGNPNTFLWKRNNKAKDPVSRLWNWSLMPLLREYLSGLEATTRSRELTRLEKVFLTVPPESN
jgi:5-methylcytosine-specific restriction protein B